MSVMILGLSVIAFASPFILGLILVKSGMIKNQNVIMAIVACLIGFVLFAGPIILYFFHTT